VPIFRRSTDYRAFLAVLREGLARSPVRLVAYCVLSNHWHLVVEPLGTKGLTDLMHWVTATHAIRWHHHHKSVGHGPIYQGRFHAYPLAGGADLVRVCRYVERNALRARLVSRAQDWPWCSLAERLRPDPQVPLVRAAFLASAAWIDYVNATVYEQERIDECLARTDHDVETRDVAAADVARAPAGRADL
jgi:putative transposase